MGCSTIASASCPAGFATRCRRRRSSGWPCCVSTATCTSRRWSALRALYPKIAAGGYAIVDDCPALASCAAAVHDYRVEHGIRERMIRIPEMGIYWQVGGPLSSAALAESAPAEKPAAESALPESRVIEVLSESVVTERGD